jgi:PAS domain S-box-containing protein
MLDAVIVLDSQGRVVDINPTAQKLVGCSINKAIGHTIEEICTLELARLAEYLTAPEMHGEVTLRNDAEPDGLRHYDLRIAPLNYGLRGRQVGRLIVLHDISARKRAEVALSRARDQAVEANRLKGRLLANVSHELRTPLNAVIGYTEMLEENNHPEQQAWLHRIAYNARQMVFFVNDLLDQAALESGQFKLHNVEFSPAELIENTRSLLGVLAEQKGLEITYVIDPFLPGKIVGDIKRLQQILVNLVNNATKFTDQGGVSVRIYGCDGDFWALEVSDTGLGIPPEAQAYVFEAFRQVDTSSTRKNRGAGLGLSIVQQLTTLMGGHVKLDSQVGHGSTFTIVVPLAPPNQEAAS